MNFQPLFLRHAPRDAKTSVPTAYGTQRKHAEISTRRRSRFAPPSTAEHDETPSEASSTPDPVDCRCQETATRSQSVAPSVVLIHHVKHIGRMAVLYMATTPKSTKIDDVVD